MTIRSKRANRLCVEPDYAFHLWIAAGSLKKATNFLASKGLVNLVTKKKYTPMAILNAVRKSPLYFEYLKAREADGRIFPTIEEYDFSTKYVLEHLESLKYTREMPNEAELI